MSTAANMVLEKAMPVKTQDIPAYLLKEEIEGIKFYWKGYRDVLNKTKKPQDIMGCSSLQSFIIDYLLETLYAGGAKRRHYLFTNESGNHLAHRNNMQFDIAVYAKADLTADKITRKYVQGIPPVLVVEVDMDVELEGTGIKNQEEYLTFRTENLLKYGVKKVLWVLTKTKKVLMAHKEGRRVEDWDKDLELIDDITFNIAAYLAQEGVDPDAA